jgi:hypothetical protein
MPAKPDHPAAQHLLRPRRSPALTPSLKSRDLRHVPGGGSTMRLRCCPRARRADVSSWPGPYGPIGCRQVWQWGTSSRGHDAWEHDVIEHWFVQLKNAAAFQSRRQVSMQDQPRAEGRGAPTSSATRLVGHHSTSRPVIAGSNSITGRCGLRIPLADPALGRSYREQFRSLHLGESQSGSRTDGRQS